MFKYRICTSVIKVKRRSYMIKKEQVIHPEHYNIEGRKECWDEFIDKFGPEYTFVWCLMTAQKYLYRKGLKDDNPEEQDKKKAIAYFNKATTIREEYPELQNCANYLFDRTRGDLKRCVHHW